MSERSEDAATDEQIAQEREFCNPLALIARIDAEKARANDLHVKNSKFGVGMVRDQQRIAELEQLVAGHQDERRTLLERVADLERERDAERARADTAIADHQKEAEQRERDVGMAQAFARVQEKLNGELTMRIADLEAVEGAAELARLQAAEVKRDLAQRIEVLRFTLADVLDADPTLPGYGATMQRAADLVHDG